MSDIATFSVKVSQKGVDIHWIKIAEFLRIKQQEFYNFTENTKRKRKARDKNNFKNGINPKRKANGKRKNEKRQAVWGKRSERDGTGVCTGMGTPCCHKAAAGAWPGRGGWGRRICFRVVEWVWVWWGRGCRTGRTGKIPKVFEGGMVFGVEDKEDKEDRLFWESVGHLGWVVGQGGQGGQGKFEKCPTVKAVKLGVWEDKRTGRTSFSHISLIAAYMDIYDFFFFYIYTLSSLSSLL